MSNHVALPKTYDTRSRDFTFGPAWNIRGVKMVAKNTNWVVAVLRGLPLAGWLVVLGCSNAGVFEAESSRTWRASGEGSEVRVVSWNMERVGEPGSMEYEALHAVLVHLDADVVGLNEVAGADEVAYLEE